MEPESPAAHPLAPPGFLYAQTMSAPLGNTPRIQAIREGIAAGRDLGVFGELIGVLDTVAAALQGLQQAVGALGARVTALEAVGHDIGGADIAAEAAVEVDGLVNAVVVAVELAADVIAEGTVDEFALEMAFAGTVEATGEVGSSDTP